MRGHSFGDVLFIELISSSVLARRPTTPNGLTHLKDAWMGDDRTVTLVGRPFPLDEVCMQGLAESKLSH